jgi:hypothetical protein
MTWWVWLAIILLCFVALLAWCIIAGLGHPDDGPD